MVVQHNMQAANANRMLNITTSAQSKSTEKLSSGYRINRAADDAAGLTISEKMRKQIKGLDRASTNAEDGVSAVQTAEGALTEVHSMLQRMNELATQSANGTNSSTDRKAIQDEIDQLTTEIDRVSETTKFNETYLLKGDGADKAHNVNAHDAGIDGVTLTDKGDTVDVTLKTLNAGDKVSIAGKNYTIGASADDGEAAFKKGLGHDTPAVGDTATLNGVEYKYYDAIKANGNNKGTAAGWYSVNPSTLLDNATSAVTAEKETTAFYAEGATTKVGNQSFTVMKGADDGIDDNDSSIITAKKAYQLETAEILKASNIGTDTAATADKNTTNLADATNKFTLTKGKVNYNDALSFNLHVGADADMTNKITVNIDSMNSAGLGIKGIKADTEQDATYAIDAIADAISTVSSQRSALGAVQNRLEHTIDNLDNVVENTTSAESRIRDTDMAEEMVAYSKNNILQQAGQSMLAQANQANQGVLSLLQ